MITLKADKRSIAGRKVKSLRREDIIPAVVYGHGIASKNIQVDYKSFQKALKEAGESSLISLEVKDLKPMRVLIHDYTSHPLTAKIEHVDFYEVKSDERLTAEVEIKLIGIAPAVKNFGGILVTPLRKIKIQCLPDDLIHQVEIDLGGLAQIGNEIKIKDLKLSDKIKILEDQETLLVKVEEPRKEEVAKPVAEAAATTAEAATTGQAGSPVTEATAAKTETKK